MAGSEMSQDQSPTMNPRSKLETLKAFAAEVRTGRFTPRFTFPGLEERIAFMEEQERLAGRSG